MTRFRDRMIAPCFGRSAFIRSNCDGIRAAGNRMKSSIFLLILLAGTISVYARPQFLELDPDVAGRHPREFGFSIISKEDGEHTVFSVVILAPANLAFKKARILILGDLKKEEIPQMTVSDTKNSKTIEIQVLTGVISEYGLQIESLPIPDTDYPKAEFAGYNIKLKK